MLEQPLRLLKNYLNNMQLHQIQKPKSLKTKKRVGRGGKRGTYSGRGVKGQKSRAGGSPRPAWRDVVKKMPKQRGYRFAPVSEKPFVINVSTLQKSFADGDMVNLQRIKEVGLVPTKKSKQISVKILGNGEISKKIIIAGLAVSKSAQEKIKKAGGKIV